MSEAPKVNPDQYKFVVDTIWPLPTQEAYDRVPLHAQLYYDVRASGLPNYRAVRRQVPSQLNCDRSEYHLQDYADAGIVDFLRYGWPVNNTAPHPPNPITTNQASATRNPTAVRAFIAKELDKEALLGPFSDPPFAPWSQVSPLMTRDKPDGSGKRVIIDLSYPSGHSVNDGIRRNWVQGMDVSYTLPRAWDLAELMARNGRGAYMWKSDLSRAYRQLRVDPLDYPLLGIVFDGEYFTDICPIFGCRASGGSQQRVSEAVVHIMRSKGHATLAYVDDFCGITPMLKGATAALADFEGLAQDLGLVLAPDKQPSPRRA